MALKMMPELDKNSTARNVSLEFYKPNLIVAMYRLHWLPDSREAHRICSPSQMPKAPNSLHAALSPPQVKTSAVTSKYWYGVYCLP